MFPINFKWVDDIYDKIDSACITLDDIVSKDQEPLKYVQGLKNVGNNVKQFCSTMDPLKYAEDQLTNLGATIEQLCSSVVPSSMDSVMSAVNNIFTDEDGDSTACTNPEINDSVDEPIASVDMNMEVMSTGKLESLKLDLEDNTAITDQSFDKDSSLTYNETDTNNTSKAGFYSPEQITEVEPKDITQSSKQAQLDESCIIVDINDWFTSQVPVDVKSPKIKSPLPATLQLRSSESHMPKRTLCKSSISKKPYIIKEEHAFSMSITSSNGDTWESEWEII